MKPIIIILFFVGIIFNGFGQALKKVIIYNYPQRVPNGKIWKIESGKKTIVQVAPSSIVSRTFCNAMFFSRPGIVFNLNRGDLYNAISFGIVTNSVEKVPYANNYTYSILPTSFIDKDLDLTLLQNKRPDEIGKRELVFYAGEMVFVANCIQSIELTEYNMSKQQIAVERQKKETIEKRLTELKSRFNIPVKENKQVAFRKNPVVHDNGFSRIEFSTNAVLYRRPNKGFSVDDTAVWSLILTFDSFNIKSSSGIDKAYTLIDIGYDEALQMKEFDLGDADGKVTHKLDIAWDAASQQYTILLISIDKSEEYQFQNTQLKSKS